MHFLDITKLYFNPFLPNYLAINTSFTHFLIMSSRLILFLLFFLVACTAVTPKNGDNICATFQENEDWYDDAKESYQRWGVPVYVQMAIMHQESHFVADARPPRVWLLGFIPWFRPTTAYGYAQALDGTWDDYLDDAGGWFSDRDDFSDAADFIGWYSNTSHAKLGISKWDTKNLYLAYHEGHDGFQRRSYLRKASLKQLADKVANRAKVFQRQLATCKMN
jgi:hypothetical protein